MKKEDWQALMSSATLTRGILATPPFIQVVNTVISCNFKQLGENTFTWFVQ